MLSKVARSLPLLQPSRTFLQPNRTFAAKGLRLYLPTLRQICAFSEEKKPSIKPRKPIVEEESINAEMKPVDEKKGN